MKLSGDSAVPSRINGPESKPVRIAPGAAVHRRLDQATGQTQTASEAGESDVRLTGRAQQLAAIEQNLRSMPAIDELRVTAVKQRLESGDYKVDAQRIADRLLRLEGAMHRDAGPLARNPLK